MSDVVIEEMQKVEEALHDLVHAMCVQRFWKSVDDAIEAAHGGHSLKVLFQDNLELVSHLAVNGFRIICDPNGREDNVEKEILKSMAGCADNKGSE